MLVCIPKNVWYTYSYTDDLVTLDITNQCKLVFDYSGVTKWLETRM